MRRIKTLVLISLCVAQVGCAAAIIPGLAGVGAGGYLWGKEASKPKTEAPTNASPPTEVKP